MQLPTHGKRRVLLGSDEGSALLEGSLVDLTLTRAAGRAETVPSTTRPADLPRGCNNRPRLLTQHACLFKVCYETYLV